jgi:hypothetical protein
MRRETIQLRRAFREWWWLLYSIPAIMPAAFYAGCWIFVIVFRQIVWVLKIGFDL